MLARHTYADLLALSIFPHILQGMATEFSRQDSNYCPFTLLKPSY
jgi:hypothetical protein